LFQDHQEKYGNRISVCSSETPLSSFEGRRSEPEVSREECSPVFFAVQSGAQNKTKTKTKTKPNQTKPNQTKPNQTKPNQTKPNQTKQTKGEKGTKTNFPFLQMS